MKIVLPLLCALSSLTLSAHAFLPPWMLDLNKGEWHPNTPQANPFARRAEAPTASGSIRATVIQAGKMTQEHWKTWWGSYDRSYATMRHIEVELQTWGRGQRQGEVEWIWFGRELKENGKRVVLQRGRFPLTLREGGGRKDIIIPSGAALGRIENYAALGERYATGEKIEGYYVRLVIDGERVSDAASHTYLADVARDPGALGQLKDLTSKYSK